MADKAIVLLSGGIDSTTALFLAKEKGWELYALSFDYAPGSRAEVVKASRIAELAGVVEHFIIPLPFYREVLERFRATASQTLGGPAVSPVYMPARNTVFYAIAAALAEAIGARWIVFGSNADDAKELPDARPEYVSLINEALEKGTRAGLRGEAARIVNPLIEMTNEEVIQLALKMGVPLELTWSCTRDAEVACGECYGCLRRLEAFEALGLKDPIPYQKGLRGG